MQRNNFVFNRLRNGTCAVYSGLLSIYEHFIQWILTIWRTTFGLWDVLFPPFLMVPLAGGAAGWSVPRVGMVS